jgi:hypothetical protein
MSSLVAFPPPVPDVRDSLGPVPIPTPPVIAAFPLKADWGAGLDYTPPMVVHTFSQAGLKVEQRFLMAPNGPRHFRFIKNHLSCTEYDNLKAHWEQAQGVYAQFPLTMYEPTGNVTYNVRYENPTLAFDHMVALLTQGPGVTFLEIPATTPDLHSRAHLVRFPDAQLTAALANEFQQIIPLITITPRGGSPIYISNQRVSVDSTVYLPRMLDWSGISQTLGESADAGSFNLGNADGVWTSLVNQVNLYAAEVQLTLFHVTDVSLLDIWNGYLTNWQFDTSGKFQINVTDGIFQLTLPYPSRKILRQCWKVYKGRFCPSTSALTTCPKDYDSCVTRGVPDSFGGVVFPPQSVRIKDSTTGVFGFGRSSFTSVSVVDDTIYQRPLQEVFTDEQMLVTCDVAEGRDENSFYAALGVVGEGPIGSYDANLINSTLDGQPPHDPLRGGGWRATPGTDPCGQYDFVGISQAPWSNPDGTPFVPPGSTFTGGIALAEIRRTDAAGLQLSAVSDHAMTVSITGGLGGWIWTGPGARSWMAALHNTIWVAVNVFLRGIGLRVDPSNQDQIPAYQMEEYFDVNQCIEMAAICDTQVPPLIGDNHGTGTELQFPFRGILKEQKPLRDWLREILNCCSGNFIFSNGKFWPFIRVNSSVLAGNAFTEATILFRSLSVGPLQPAFNWVVGNFGDEEFGWQLNNCTLYDIDHASTLGTPESPQYLIQTMNFAGVSNLSQCARLLTARLREEIGGLAAGSGPHGTGSGINEQLNARNFQFRTTILALGTQLGDIVSLTHSSLPNSGYAEGRVSRWALNPDFSIDIQCSSTTDDMYDLTVGPKPQDVAPPAAPPELLQPPIGLAWLPDMEAPQAGDPIYAAWERTFKLWQDYNIGAQGNWIPTIWVQGDMTVNQFGYPTQPRILDIELSSGGNLDGPQTVYVALTQWDNAGVPSTPSNLAAVWIPQGLTGQQLTLTVAPSTDPALIGYDVWAANDRRQIAFQFNGTGTPPASIVIPGPIQNWTQGLPEGSAWGVQIQAKTVLHAGTVGVLVSGVTAPNLIQSDDFIGATDNWVGQFLFVCSNVAGEVPLWNFKITAFNASTGTMTVTPDCVTGDPQTSVGVGDVLIVWAQPTSADANSITNAMWDNSVTRNQFPGSAGMQPGKEVGYLIRILRGTGAGQWRNITDNNELTHQIAPPWSVIPDATSLYIVEAADWLDPSQTSQMSAPTNNILVQLHTQVPNLSDEVVLVGGYLVDTNGNKTDDGFACYRMIYIFGQPPNVRTLGPGAGPFDIKISDEVIRVDTSANDVAVNLLPLADYQGRGLLVFNIGPNNTVIAASGADVFPDGTQSYTLSAAGSTVRITAGGIYTP